MESAASGVQPPLVLIDLGGWQLGFDTVLTLLGIVITIGTFLFGYRHTIGARRERARAANKEIIETLMRRLVLEESFTFDHLVLSRLIVGKAVDSAVRLADLFNGQTVISILHQRIVESDYIDPKQRALLLDRISKYSEKAAKEDLGVEDSEEHSKNSGPVAGEFILGLGALSAGVTAAGFTIWLAGGRTDLNLVASFMDNTADLVFGFSIILMAAFTLATLTYVRNRTKEQVSTTVSEVRSDEDRVRQILSASGVEFQEPFDGPDFLVFVGKKRYGIEVLSRNVRIPTVILQRKIERLQKLVQEEAIDEMVLVGRISRINVAKLNASNLKFASIRELYNYIRRWKGPQVVVRETM